MYCKHCGKELDDKAEICIHCGQRVRNSFSSILENSELTQLRPQSSEKSPGLAGFLGFILGWFCIGPVGYIYLGQWNWFWITIVISILAYPLTGFVGAYVVFPFIFAFHQHQMAKDLNQELEKARAQNSTNRTLNADSTAGPGGPSERG
ncbi:MAG: zinc ribbon domain-containing protein [Candidatus Latescibacterota bacterium]|jgi:hypothetical protein